MKLLLCPALVALSLAACAAHSDEQATAQPASAAPVDAMAAPASVAASEAPAQAAQPSMPADAGKEAEVDARIDKVLGDHKAYRSALERLQAAVGTDDRSGVAALVRYPLAVSTLTGKIQVDNAKDFIAHYPDIVTPVVAQAIAKQRYAELFVSQNGVMLGSGEVWINGVCHDPQCVDVDVKVVTFQQGG
ncbi:hypothetical protein SAMN05428989_2767 [Pseudoxanthomonas sp. GM95]|uniref:hypothetical protein n=1 Tax=Pseudoxanthomonas sp. GM95 TaxID=1881043 RepID=UPI0008C541FF|nr:hypothetical protein [Pseudoxanthomonas sp. GM95]SEL88004.1 hypothetical protein SAMN05428989_2767 [Pseudoxanthomonas sp. GM95]